MKVFLGFKEDVALNNIFRKSLVSTVSRYMSWVTPKHSTLFVSKLMPELVLVYKNRQ